MKRFTNDRWIIAWLVCIVLLFFYKTMFRGLYPVPSDALVGLYHPFRDYYSSQYPRGMPFKNFLITDPIRQQIPWKHEVIESWKNGRLPTFNPYSFSGADLTGNIQAAAFTPFNLLFFIVPFIDAWAVYIILSQVLTVIFFYLYIRNRKVSRMGSIIGSLAWGFSGFTIAWLTWGTIIHVAAWLPLGLLAIDKLRFTSKNENIHNRWLLLLGIVWVMHIVSGHMQIAFYVIGFEIIYALYSWSIRRYKYNFRSVVSILVTIGIGFCISSFQIIPFVQSFLSSGRAMEVNGYLKEGWFVPYIHLVQFFAPDFFGNPTTLNYWGAWNYAEFVGYIGIFPMIFVLFAFYHWKIMWRWFMALMLLFLLVLPTPVGVLPNALHVPVLSSMQPTRLMVLIDFILAISVAYGFDFFVKTKWKNIRTVIIVIHSIYIMLWIIVLIKTPIVFGASLENALVARRNLLFPTIMLILADLCIAGYLALSKKMKKASGVLTACIIVIVIIDVFRFGWKFTPFTSGNYFFPVTKSISFLQSQPRPFRIASFDDRVFPPNIGSFYGIEDVGGYDPVYNARYEKLIAAIEANSPLVKPPYGFNRILTLKKDKSTLLPLFNIAYVLSINPIDDTDYTHIFGEGETKIYEYQKNLGRAWAVDTIIAASNEAEALFDLFDAQYDPKSMAVVEGFARTRSFKNSDLQIIYTGNSSHKTMHITSSENTFLVISEVYNPRWDVSLDNHKVQVYKTNYAFMGIILPQGKHEVVLRFR